MWKLLRDIREEDECRTCEALRESLHHERALNRELLNKLLNKDAPVVPTESARPEPIEPKYTPWNVRRAQLEKQSRVLAEKLETEKLEKEMKLDIPTEELSGRATESSS